MNGIVTKMNIKHYACLPTATDGMKSKDRDKAASVRQRIAA